MQPWPSWGSGTRGAMEIKKEATCHGRAGHRLLQSVDWPGLLAWHGVSVGLTIDRPREEPPQQKKTVAAKALRQE